MWESSRRALALIATLLTLGVGVAPAGAAPTAIWKVQGPGPGLSAKGCLQQSDRKLILTSPTSGVTSPNSKHNRCELREMVGKEEAGWNPAKGTHKLTTRLAVTELPKTEPEVVVAQIHGGGDDIITWRLEGRHLFVKVGDNATPYATLTRNYQRGTPLTLGFTTAGGKIHATANGRIIATVDAPDDPGSYFKTGAYEQSHTQGDGVARVVMFGEPVVSHGNVTMAPRRAPTPLPRRSAPRQGDVDCSRNAGNTLPRLTIGTPPTLTNTGPPRGTRLTVVNGDLTTQGNGQVITKVNVRGTIHVKHSNVIIKCSEVDTKIEIGSGVRGTKIWNVKIGEAGSSIGGDEGIGTHDFVARRVQIAGTTDGIRVTGPNVALQDSLLHSPWDNGPPHADGAHISTGADNVLISDNRIHWTPVGPGRDNKTTSNIIMFQEDKRVTVVRNTLTGDTHACINRSKVGSATVERQNKCANNSSG